MLLIWLGVKVVSWIVQHKKYTYLVFGEYGKCHLLCPQGLGVLPAGNGDKKMAGTGAEMGTVAFCYPFLKEVMMGDLKVHWSVAGW